MSAPIVVVGKGQQLSFTIYIHDGSQFGDTHSASWSSLNQSVATISGPGLVNGISGGSVAYRTSELVVAGTRVFINGKVLRP